MAEAGEYLLEHEVALLLRDLGEALVEKQGLYVLVGLEPGVAMELLAVRVEEDLGGDVLDRILLGRCRVFVHIVEDDLDLIAEGLSTAAITGRISLQGMHVVEPSSTKVTFGFAPDAAELASGEAAAPEV